MPQEPRTGAGQETGRTLNRRGLLSCLAVGVAALAGCQPPPQAPLKLGMNPWVGYDPMVLARDRGLLDAAQVKVVELASGSETMRYLRNGLLDGAALTLDEALRLADDGVDLRIVLLLSTSAGADVVMARSDIRSPVGLRGRSIAVERTTVGALMLQRLPPEGAQGSAEGRDIEEPLDVSLEEAEESWRRALMLASSATSAELVDRETWLHLMTGGPAPRPPTPAGPGQLQVKGAQR